MWASTDTEMLANSSSHTGFGKKKATSEPSAITITTAIATQTQTFLREVPCADVSSSAPMIEVTVEATGSNGRPNAVAFGVAMITFKQTQPENVEKHLTE
eukprot:TRINITY_DN10124_c0_g1_i3.p2 TRINITY_DN10124_c0_g1~~TRINITY_DN10124_c0_g1_i3.p2  ORF type:complete len:100 (-),score=11.97 TRINITY_DN10124_c0_g1_i3:14-313(-)